MAFNSSSEVNSTYNPIGVNYPDNLRIGTFQMGNTNTSTLGVQVGNPILITMQPANGGNLVTGQTVNNGSYMQLNGANGNAGAIVQNNRLVLDYERTVVITNPTGQFSAQVSGFDMYEQPAVFKGISTNSNPYTFSIGGCLKKITSVLIYGAAGNYSYTLATDYQFGMPFVDLQNPTTNPNTFMNPQANGQPFLMVSATSPNRRAVRSFTWFPLAAFKSPGENESVRTRLVVVPGNTPTMGIISLEMQVRNYGFSWLMNEPYNLQTNRTDSNVLRKYIGYPPYKIGWTDWKG